MGTLRRNRGDGAEARTRRRCTRVGESGQVVVVFALFIPILFALTAIVLDVGNGMRGGSPSSP